MGTRTIIEFKQGMEKIQVYQQSDGYPSHTLKRLEEFLKWNDVRNDQLDYSVANFILYNKLRNVIDYEFVKPEHNKEKDFRKFFLNHDSNMSMFHTGYGIQSSPLNEAELKESPIEWFYQVSLINADHLDTFHNKEYTIKIDCFVVGSRTFKLIGSCTYDHKAGKITKYDKKLLLEVEN